MSNKVNHFKQVAAAAGLALALALSAAGCQKTETASDMDLSSLESYPIETDKELSYWCELPTSVSATTANFGDTYAAQKLEEATGVKVKYIHPAQGQTSEAFSLMVASNELPDMVFHYWNSALGSPTSAIEDNIILSLNDLVGQYAPNLSAYLKANPDIDKMIKTDDGDYYEFPFIRGDAELRIPSGPLIRKDWLDELGLAEPTTIDELEQVLIAFRDQKGVEAPATILSGELRALFTLMSSTDGFYLDNGQVKYGPMEPAYKAAIERLNRWFNTGLLDKNFTLADRNMQNSRMMNGESGFTYSGCGGSLGMWLSEASDPNYNVVGLRYFPSEGSEYCKTVPAEFPFGGAGAAITSACKYPELAAKWLDYSYGEEGHMLANFGVENETYTLVDGEPVYTDLIMNNPDGLPVNYAMAQYFRSNTSGAFVQDGRYFEQYCATPQQKEALAKWTVGVQETQDCRMPVVTLTSEESEEFSNIMTEVQKLRDEDTATFISGVKPLDEYDGFLQRMEELNIQRAIEIQQAAYDRYQSR